MPRTNTRRRCALVAAVLAAAAAAPDLYAQQQASLAPFVEAAALATCDGAQTWTLGTDGRIAGADGYCLSLSGSPDASRPVGRVACGNASAWTFDAATKQLVCRKAYLYANDDDDDDDIDSDAPEENYGDELAALNDEAEIPVEELMRRYKAMEEAEAAEAAGEPAKKKARAE